MPSFEMSYEYEDDVLEITFEPYDETFARTIPLNDHIFLFTDLSMAAVWGMTLYSYSKLLGVSETELSSLREIPDNSGLYSHFVDETAGLALYADSSASLPGSKPPESDLFLTPDARSAKRGPT